MNKLSNMNNVIEELDQCYNLKDLRKLKKKYGTVNVSMNYSERELCKKDKISSFTDIDVVIFYEIFIMNLFNKELKYHSYFGKTIAVVPYLYYILLSKAEKILQDGIRHKNQAMEVCDCELKFNHTIKSMKQIKIYT